MWVTRTLVQFLGELIMAWAELGEIEKEANKRN